MNPSVVLRPPKDKHMLDEIIQAKLNNPAWKEMDLISFLCPSCTTVKEMLRTWNRHKIQFAKIPPDTAL